MESFRHSDAYARGYTADLVRNPRHFVHPVDGVAQPASTADDLVETCQAIALQLPAGAVFTHATAALLRGWWMPLLDDWPIVAGSDKDGVHLDRRGVYVRRCDIPPGHRTYVDGVPVASAAWTIVELAEHFALLDLVAVIDSALHLRHTTVDQIRATMRKGRRGVRVLRRALDLVDGRSESWWESMLRLLHVLSGFAVEPQYVVRNRAGVEVARADLKLLHSNRIAEYDGADHRDRLQHQRDLRREKALAREGLERYGYVATELLNTPAMIVRDAEAARGLPHFPARMQRWHDEARLATISFAGQAALRRRLKRFVRTQAGRSSSPSGANRSASGASTEGAPSHFPEFAPLAGGSTDILGR
ncbi:hypothetical protein GCM10022234_14450 [Aeromicrobium panaciterrae]|uniref:hypothetical protein n=1 Tax=Aeromicrobium panaciterrae TaxID=363861 RepID=UPI0031CF6D5E